MEKNPNRSTIILGTLLLTAGILTLLGQVIAPAGGLLWPLIVIGVGLAFFVGMLLGGRSFGALAIPGSIITGVGLLLLFQNMFGMWETWSYTWALVISMVGIGLVIYGAWTGRADLRRGGWDTARVGVTLFIIFGLISEFVFSVSGISSRTGGLFWPAMLVLLGIVMILSRSYRLIRGREEDRRADLNLFWPVLFIGAGLMWYLVQRGALAASDLTVLISLWPVLLIAGGVNLLLGRRLQWMNLLLGMAVVVGAFYVVYNSQQLGLAQRSPWSILGVSISQDQPVNQWIGGSGVMAEETREVGDFQRVSLNSAGELILTPGNLPGLTIEAEDNLLPYLETEVEGDRLIIRTKPGIGFSTTRTIRYHLTFVDLRDISISGSGSVRGGPIEGDELRVTLSGIGGIDLEDVQVDSFAANLSGSGAARISGSTRSLTVSISGAGSYNSPDFAAEDAEINISGLGRAVVWANSRLKTSISGMGGVSYYGSPSLIEQTSGIGTVRKLDDR